MTYAYFIENASNEEFVDNSPLFQFVREIGLTEDKIFADPPGEREEAQQMVQRLEPGDNIILRSIQDLAVNTSQLLKILSRLAAKKVDIISVLEPEYEHNSTISKLFEIDKYYKQQNQKAGYAKAKASGRLGRPRNPKLEQALQLYQDRKMTVDQIAKLTGVSSSTLYRHLLRATEKSGA